MQRLLVVLCLVLLLEPRQSHAEENLPGQTVVVFNKAIAESSALAQFYAEKRGIAGDHLVGLDCPKEEEISRDQYDSSIAEPLRRIFQERGWWKVRKSAEGVQGVESSSIHFVALMKGMPLKIRRASNYPQDVAGSGPIQDRNEASVDSELSTLGFFSKQISGALNNLYFQSYKPIAQFSQMPLLLVTRLDAPDAASVRRMITNAIETEKSGLWGRAFVDASHSSNSGFEMGDAWMNTIVDQLHKAGIPVVYEGTPGIFPEGFPMSDCALYYGWYAANIAGPFNQADLKLMPGAVAIHVHSFSAGTLRDANSGWAGPLIARGATATLGNVYEPYLQLTAHLDTFNDRLLHGFTFAECAYMSLRVLSWMNVAIGDPLYRPYLNWTQLDTKTPKNLSEWRAYHEFAVKNVQAPEYRAQAGTAAARTRNGPMMEDLASMELRDGNFAAAITELEQARSYYSKRDDLLRCVLAECDALVRSGKQKRALDLARGVLRVVPDAPASALLRKIVDDLTPKAATSPASSRRR